MLGLLSRLRRRRATRLQAALNATFHPRRVFQGGQQGMVYEVLDPAKANEPVMYQDSAGTTSTTVELPAGLLMDARLGLARGPNLISGDNSTFTAGVGSWATSASFASTAAAVGGELQVTITASFGRQILAVACTAGRTYEVAGTARVVSGVGDAMLGLSNSNNGSSANYQLGATTSTAIPVRAVMVAIGSTIYLTAGLNSNGLTGGVFAFDNVSIRELYGNHLVQATAASRPTYSKRYNILLATATLATQSVTTLAASYHLSFTGTGTVTLTGTSTAGPLVGTGANDRVSLDFTPTAGSLTLTVSGSVTFADLRLADDLAKYMHPYQRVGATAADHDTEGFFGFTRLDGGDDSATTATGGGVATGFHLVACITVTGGAGGARTIWSDTGTNTGYRVRANASNQLELAAGNGSAYTTVTTTDTLTAPGTYVISAFDDGTVLGVQIDNGAITTVARPSVSAGTAAVTIGKDNGAATSFFNGRIYGMTKQDVVIGAPNLTRLKKWMAAQAGKVLA